jgi:hypothetical protein
VMQADIATPSGTSSSSRSSASTRWCHIVSAPPYPSARAARSRFWHAG